MNTETIPPELSSLFVCVAGNCFRITDISTGLSPSFRIALKVVSPGEANELMHKQQKITESKDIVFIFFNIGL